MRLLIVIAKPLSDPRNLASHICYLQYTAVPKAPNEFHLELGDIFEDIMVNFSS